MILRSYSLLIFLLCFSFVISYKPVVLLHGVLSGADSMTILKREIEKSHPGTKVYNCDKFTGWNSLESSWRQVADIREYIKAVGDLHPSSGLNLIGHSQGGLLARAVLQSLPNHNVKTFISLSAPQAGQFGTSFLHLIFPNLVAKTAYELFYSKLGQYISVGNYWNDPHKYDLYLKYNVFLPYINNEIESSNSTQFKDGIKKLDKMVLVGGPNDEVITPWESSHFGYFNQSLDIIPWNQRSIYKDDTIGLRFLQSRKKLEIITKPFVHHLSWHTNIHVIHDVILPYLD